MGQFWTEITPVSGSILDGHQHPNGIQRVYQYDKFGREKFRQINYVGTSTIPGPSVTTEYLSCDATVCDLNSERYRVRTTASGQAPVTSYHDSRGNKRRVVSKNMDGVDITTTRTVDAKGRTIAVTDPYLAGATSYPTLYAYDEVGRIATITEPANRVTTYAYNGLTLSVTNPKLQTSSKTFDSLGRIVFSTDAATNALQYFYGPDNQIVRIVDAKGNQTNYLYDAIGRRYQEQDPDFGVWTYGYNTLGELLSQTDAKNQSTQFSYDKLGRMTQRTEPDLVSAWIWDTAANGIGNLAALTGSNGFERHYEYDVFSRLHKTRTSKSIDPNSLPSDPDYVHEVTYDAIGRRDVVTYPTGFAYRHVYDQYGFLSELRDNTNNQLYWKANKRDAFGRVTRQTAGNGLVTDRKYKADTGYLDTVQTGTLSGNVLSATVQNDAYGFDDIGNLVTRSQYFDSTSLTETFGYDNLSRLESASVLGGASASVTYDEIGNITHRSDVGGYSYTGCGGVHRVCGITGSINSLFTYDANGNMQSGNGRSISWNAANYPEQIVRGATTETYMYSPERERVRRVTTVGGQETISLYLNPRIDLGDTLEITRLPNGESRYSHYLYAEGEVIAAVVSKNQRFLSPPPTWQMNPAVAPTTSNPNLAGFTMPTATADPHSTVLWDANNSDGRIALHVRKISGGDFATVNGQRNYTSEDVVFRARVTTTATVSPVGRYMHVGVTNGVNGLSNRSHFALFNAGRVYAAYADGTVNYQHPSALKIYQQSSYFTALDNQAYVVEIETTPSTSTLYVYPEGGTRESGLKHSLNLDWRVGGSNYARRFQGIGYASTLIGENVIYVNGLSEGPFAPRYTQYFHTDHQGSVTVITDESKAVVERMSFDAWGRRRHLDGVPDVAGTLRGMRSVRGYTFHEHLDDVALVHMNGRVYDPQIARFLSADPYVPDPLNLQDFNRYSYVINNPLGFVDPSGFTPCGAGTISCNVTLAWSSGAEITYRYQTSTPVIGLNPVNSAIEGLSRQVIDQSIRGVHPSGFHQQPDAGARSCQPGADCSKKNAQRNLRAAAANLNEKADQIDDLTAGFGYGSDAIRFVVSGTLRDVADASDSLADGDLDRFALSGVSLLTRGAGRAYKMGANRAGRSGALNQAKRDLGIPRTQHPDSVTKVPMTDLNGKAILGADGKPIMTREYTYTRPDGSKVIIQDHSAGHRFGQGGAGDQGSHLNVRPPENTRTGSVSGTQDHYSW